MPSSTFTFKAKVWLYAGNGPWHFVTLPVEIAQEIQVLFGFIKKGFGSVPVKVTVGKTSWNTSIFPDKKSGSYVLPLKKDVRKAENIKLDSTTTFTVEIKA